MLAHARAVRRAVATSSCDAETRPRHAAGSRQRATLRRCRCRWRQHGRGACRFERGTGRASEEPCALCRRGRIGREGLPAAGKVATPSRRAGVWRWRAWPACRCATDSGPEPPRRRGAARTTAETAHRPLRPGLRFRGGASAGGSIPRGRGRRRPGRHRRRRRGGACRRSVSRRGHAISVATGDGARRASQRTVHAAERIESRIRRRVWRRGRIILEHFVGSRDCRATSRDCGKSGSDETSPHQSDGLLGNGVRPVSISTRDDEREDVGAMSTGVHRQPRRQEPACDELAGAVSLRRSAVARASRSRRSHMAALVEPQVGGLCAVDDAAVVRGGRPCGKVQDLQHGMDVEAAFALISTDSDSFAIPSRRTAARYPGDEVDLMCGALSADIERASRRKRSTSIASCAGGPAPDSDVARGAVRSHARPRPAARTSSRRFRSASGAFHRGCPLLCIAMETAAGQAPLVRERGHSRGCDDR